MIESTVAEMYRADDENRFLEVTYQNGDKEILFYRDFASGAMIENIVRRAKKLAIKREIAGEGERHPHRRPPRVDPPGVQGERGPPQHDQPRRLGPDLGQEGGADRLRAHPAQRGPRHHGEAARSSGSAPVSTSERPGPQDGGPGSRVGPWPSPRSAGSRPSTASTPSAATGTPSPPPRCSSTPTSPQADRRTGWDFEDETPGQRRPRLRPRGLDAPDGRDPPGQHGAHQRGPLLRRPRPPRVLDPRVRATRSSCVVHDKAGEEVLRRSMTGRRGHVPRQPGGRRLQEQLRRQGQLLRLPRELPHGPGRPLRPGGQRASCRTS